MLHSGSSLKATSAFPPDNSLPESSLLSSKMRCSTSRHSALRHTLSQGSPSNRVLLLMARARLSRTWTSRRSSQSSESSYQNKHLYLAPPQKSVLKKYITRSTPQTNPQKRKLGYTINTLIPAARKVTIKRLIKKYKPLSYLQPHAVIDSTVRKSYLASISTVYPPKNDSRMIYKIGREICQASCLSMRAANTTADLGSYQRSLWETMQKFIDYLPMEKREDFQKIINEGLLVSNHIISAAGDTFDLSAFGYCQGISVQRFSRLRLNNTKPCAQQKPIALPFSSNTLFGSKLDNEIHHMKAEADSSKVVEQNKNRVHHASL